MFSEHELDIIRKARKKLSRSKFSTIFMVLILAALIFAMFNGQIGDKEFTFLIFTLVFLTIAQPQLGPGPKYADLVELLESKK